MHQNVVIRPMNAQDITMLVRDFAFPWSTPEETNKRWQKYYTQQQEGVRTVAVLATAAELLGYGSLLLQSEYPHFANVAENIPEICDVWIHEKHRRSGLGKKLLTWLELLAKKQGYNQIGIGVGLYADYGPAQQLYFQLGYAPDGHGITYKCQPTTAGKTYPLDDDLILWLTKSI